MKNAFLLLLLLAGGRVSYAQTASAGSQSDPLSTFFTAPEKVLPRLYEAAIVHSGEIERLNATHDIAAGDVKLAQKRLLSQFALGGSYTYGTIPYLSNSVETSTSTGTGGTGTGTGTGGTGTGTGGGTTTTSNSSYNPFAFGGARSQYSVGVSAAIPFDFFLARNTAVRRSELIVDQIVAQHKSAESSVRQLVITQYQALVLARATQQASQEAWQSASIGKKIADKRFRDGDIQIDEQMAAQDLYTKAVLAQAEANNRYQTAQLLLEDLIGTSINNIMLGK